MKMVEIQYKYRGATYVRADKAEEALDRIESLTASGAIILKIERFTIGELYASI